MSLRCACCEVNSLMPTATRTHPDRLATATPAEKRAATEKFQVRSFAFNQPCACVKPPMQAVADAYYVLSDTTRRKEYDMLYSSRRPQERTTEPNASSNFFTAFTNMFGSQGASGAQSATGATASDRPDAEHVFADVFEEVRVRSSSGADESLTRRLAASPSGSRAACPMVVMARCRLRSWPRFHHRQRPWAHGGSVRW